MLIFILFVFLCNFFGSLLTVPCLENVTDVTCLFSVKWAVLFMKQISEVEEKPFTSSLTICPEAFCRNGWGGRSNTSPLAPSQRIRGYFIKRRRNRYSPPRCWIFSKIRGDIRKSSCTTMQYQQNRR
jgi:hypothetical protein